MLKIGDIVILNSGGPSMAIIGKSSENVVCVWGSSSGEQYCSAFNIKTVTKEK